MKEAGNILQELVAAAENRQLAPSTICSYQRTWRKLAAYCTAESLALESLSPSQAQDIYALLTEGRGASHHLQVKGAIAFLYRRLGQQNPFIECIGPKFDINRTELKYLTATQAGILLRTMKERQEDYFSRLAYHLAEALLLTGQRFHEWAGLTRERIVKTSTRTIVRIKGKGGTFADIPLPEPLARSLNDWLSFLVAAQGVRLRRGGSAFAASPYLFPGRDGKPASNNAFNARLKASCRTAQVPVITAHGLRHTAATLLLNESGRGIREVQELLRHKSLVTTSRYTHVTSERVGEMVDELGAIL